MTQQYYFGTKVSSDWKNGSTYQYTTGDGFEMLTGEVIEADPPRKLVTTFHAHWDEESEKAGKSTVTCEITPMGDAVKLTLRHEGLSQPGQPAVHPK